MHKCNFPGCRRSFSRSSHLQRHKRSHSSQKPYKCVFSDCKSAFNRRDCWREHLRSVHQIFKVPQNDLPPSYSQVQKNVLGQNQCQNFNAPQNSICHCPSFLEVDFASFQSYHPNFVVKF